jgi:cytochrome P450
MDFMTDFITEDMRRDPYPTYARLRQQSPVLRIPGTEMWMVLDHDGVKRALHDHECFSNNVGPTRNLRFEWLLFMDPPRHTHLRGIVSKAFTPRSIAGLESRIGEITRDLLDRLAGGTELDLALDLATPLPLQVIAEMLGLPGERWPELRRWSEAIMNLGSTIMGTPEQSAAASAAFLAADAQMRAELSRECAVRTAHPRDDLLTRLLQAEVDGAHLTEEEVLRFVQLLLAAGTETTTNLISNAVLCLLEHPAELARLRATPELLASAIEEVLRYRSPAQSMFRATRRDVELGGQVIPAGKMVLAVLGSANRDERHFADASRFDIGRDPNPHLAFGHGIHFCLGAPLSRLEARVALGELLARFPVMERASDEPWRPRQPFHVHGPRNLPLRVKSRV